MTMSPHPGPEQSWQPSAITAPAMTAPRGRRRAGGLWALAALSLGACLAALSIGLFVASMVSSQSPRIENERAVPADGTPLRAELRGERRYSLYSDAEDVSCTITGPSGARLGLEPPSEGPGGGTDRETSSWTTAQPERLSFTAQHDGVHRLACTAAGPIILNLSRDTSENNREAHSLFMWSGLALALSVPLILGGGSATVVRRIRMHREAQMLGMQAAGPQQWGWTSWPGAVPAAPMTPATRPPAAPAQALPAQPAWPCPSSVYGPSPAHPAPYPPYPASSPVLPTEYPQGPGAPEA